MNKDEIIKILSFVKDNEPVNIDGVEKDSRTPIIKKLHAEGYLLGHLVNGIGRLYPSLVRIKISVKGSLLLEELQDNNYKVCFSGKYPSWVERAFWIIFLVSALIICRQFF